MKRKSRGRIKVQRRWEEDRKEKEEKRGGEQENWENTKGRSKGEGELRVIRRKKKSQEGI